MSAEPTHDADEKPALMQLGRPPFQLRSLPIKYRWEACRRHPLYQLYWETALSSFRGEVAANKQEELLRDIAVTLLTAIGISGEPPDPSTPFEALGAEQLDRAWLAGAVHPFTLRGMARILLQGLSKDALCELSHLFGVASDEDVPNNTPARVAMLQRLARISDSTLDSYPNEPFVSINPAASERQITAAIHQLLTKWKSERGLTDTRVQIDSLGDYFDIWDQREGWIDGKYDRRQELFLRDIAKRVKRPLSTAWSQYCRAYELITGFAYSPSHLVSILWMSETQQTFGHPWQSE